MTYFGAIWREVMAEERASLYASPERCVEIERMQPETESQGRALFYRPGNVTGTRRKAKSHRVEEEKPIPGWRKTFEFDGDEVELGDEELAVAAD